MTTYTSPQDGTTLDTKLYSALATTNYHTNPTIDVGEANTQADYKMRTLIQIPGLSNGTIQAGATILSATLYLRVAIDYSTNARTFRVFRSKRDVDITTSTWNIWKTGSNWSTAGGFHADDCEQTDIGSVDFANNEAVGTWIPFALTASAIQEIVNGTWTTPTLFIKADTESNDGYGFHSSNAVTETDRPYIVVTYLLGGQVIIWQSE